MRSGEAFLTQRTLGLAVLAGAGILLLGLYLFDTSLSYSASYAAGTVISAAICIRHIQKFHLPSWRGGIPLFYFVMFFTMPLFQQLTGFLDLQVYPGVPRAWLYATIGLIVFSISTEFFNAQYPAGTRAAEALWPLNRATSFIPALVLAVIGVTSAAWSVRYGYFGLQIVDADRKTTTAGVVSSLAIFIDIASVIAWCEYLKNSRPRAAWFVLAIALFLANLYFGLYSNSKSALLKPFILPVLVYFSVRRRMNAAVIVGLILAYALVVYPFVTTFRLQYGQDELSGSELFNDSVYHFTSLDWIYGSNASVADDSEAFSSLGRSLFLTFNSIVDTVQVKGALDGKTVTAAAAFFVPRALWPDKPEETVGNLVGHYIGVLQPWDMVTNVSPTQMGELYMNFGLIGLIAGMAIWGFIAHATDKKMCSSPQGWLAIYLFTLLPLQESTFGQGILALVKASPVYIIVFAAAAGLGGLFKPRERLVPITDVRADLKR